MPRSAGWRKPASVTRAAYRTLGNDPRCGRCLDVAQDLIDRIHESPNVSPPIAPDVPQLTG